MELVLYAFVGEPRFAYTPNHYQRRAPLRKQGISGSSDAPQGVRRPSFRWAIEQQLGLIFDFLESETELLLIVGRGAVPMRKAKSGLKAVSGGFFILPRLNCPSTSNPGF